jgi:hypothetical protein
MGITDKRLWRIVEHYVRQAVAAIDLLGLCDAPTVATGRSQLPDSAIVGGPLNPGRSTGAKRLSKNPVAY